MLKRFTSLTVACLLASGAACAETRSVPLSFSPKSGIDAKVTVRGTRVDYEVTKGRETSAEKLIVETEKRLRIDVADYNFDGYTDFAVSHIDDGQGTYFISYIFVYDPKKNRFAALTPKCGDSFINVRLDRKRRTLTNTYYAHNEVSSCKERY